MEAVKNLEAAAKDPPAYGERDVVRAGDGTPQGSGTPISYTCLESTDGVDWKG
jgi:hypothetical protein